MKTKPCFIEFPELHLLIKAVRVGKEKEFNFSA